MSKSPLNIKISEITVNHLYEIELETGGHLYRGIVKKVQKTSRRLRQ